MSGTVVQADIRGAEVAARVDGHAQAFAIVAREPGVPSVIGEVLQMLSRRESQVAHSHVGFVQVRVDVVHRLGAALLLSLVDAGLDAHLPLVLTGSRLRRLALILGKV